MAQAGGRKRGPGPNQYLAKVECECESPIPQGDGDCMKCGHWIDAAGLAPLPSLYGDGAASVSVRHPARGRTSCTTGPAPRI